MMEANDSWEYQLSLTKMIQQAIMQVLSSSYEEGFSEYNFVLGPKRNAHMAINHTLEIINQGNNGLLTWT